MQSSSMDEREWVAVCDQKCSDTQCVHGPKSDAVTLDRLGEPGIPSLTVLCQSLYRL